MKIGLDFDDVTVDFFSSLLKWHNEKYNRNDKKEDFKEFAWAPFWQVTREESIKRVNDYLETHRVAEVFPVEDAIPSLNNLLKKHELIVITGRPPRFKERVEEWLIHHLKRNLQVIHAGEFHKHHGFPKAEICKDLGIPILLEDAPETAKNCADTGIKVILFDAPWNQGFEYKNVVRVKSWKEALLEIQKLEKELS